MNEEVWAEYYTETKTHPKTRLVFSNDLLDACIDLPPSLLRKKNETEFTAHSIHCDGVDDVCFERQTK